MKEFIYDDGYISISNRGLKKIAYTIKDECWECVSHAKVQGYPVAMRIVDGKIMRSNLSRIIYCHHYKENIGELKIRHKCDNRLCINPLHLELGTHEENMQDKYDRKRQTKGEEVHTSKLTVKDVIVIKIALRDKTMTQKKLAKNYGVTQSTISGINNSYYWKDVTI